MQVLRLGSVVFGEPRRRDLPERATLLGIGNGHSRLNIRVVIGGDPPFASLLHHDLQQACTEASLVIGIRPRKQLLNSGH